MLAGVQLPLAHTRGSDGAAVDARGEWVVCKNRSVAREGAKARRGRSTQG